MQKLGNIISSVNLNANEDRLIWLPSGNMYSTKNGMELWDNKDSKIVWKWKFLWKILVPPNVKLFLWKVHSEILPTISFLKKRVGDQFDSCICQLCSVEEKDQTRLL